LASNAKATGTISFMSQANLLSIAWGSPNVASVPISVLEPDP